MGEMTPVIHHGFGEFCTANSAVFTIQKRQLQTANEVSKDKPDLEPMARTDQRGEIDNPARGRLIPIKSVDINSWSASQIAL